MNKLVTKIKKEIEQEERECEARAKEQNIRAMLKRIKEKDDAIARLEEEKEELEDKLRRGDYSSELPLCDLQWTWTTRPGASWNGWVYYNA